ncbi:MAG: S41 family peptidase [Bacteroidales bacterium]|jgi:carboxyl-terminal processing protease|nr:S41 family peptidase [Bacteroidales bacterium]
MKKNRTRNLFIISGFVFVALLTCNFIRNDFEIAKNLDIYSSLLKQLDENYVDNIAITDLNQTAIDAMLNKLDPYTVYYPESDLEEFKLMTTGQYGGIGATIQHGDEYVMISEPYDNWPAFKAGLQPGDQIIEIGGKNLKGKSVSDVSSMLKGQPGTTLSLSIIPYGTTKIVKKEIVREEIKLPPVSYYSILEDTTVGYIRLDQFTDNASLEVKSAFLKLKEKGMQRLILDLRGNTGGLLSEAVNIINLFVDKGKLIVSTKGKIAERNQFFYTQNTPVDLEIPLVVLVDGMSASASEIVSGALQDMDRAVIVGQRTFGKGLVQNIFPLSYNTRLKVTVSKYYLPSGRCIQKVDYSHKDSTGRNVSKADSIAMIFKTNSGRNVYDYGGVEPDIVLAKEEYSTVLLAMLRKNIIFNYANEFKLKNTAIPAVEKFVFTDAMYDDFLKYVNEKHLEYETFTEKQLKQLKESVKADKLTGNVDAAIASLEAIVLKDKATDLTRFKKEISELLETEIISRYYYQKGKIQASLKIDTELKQASQLLKDNETYSAILKGTYIHKKN